MEEEVYDPWMHPGARSPAGSALRIESPSPRLPGAFMTLPESRKTPPAKSQAPTQGGTTPGKPPPATPPAVKKEDISRWEGEGGAPPSGSQGRSKDGSGTGKVPAQPPPRRKT
jgi:hypothetical protein